MSFFPTAVPTSLQLLDARNNKKVILDGTINDVVTTIPVVDTSDIPTSGYLTFEDGTYEVIQYTGVTLTTLTGCTRGADGTTASSHATGVGIGMWDNSRYHNILKEEIIGIAQNLSIRLGLGSTDIINQQSVVGSDLSFRINNTATSGVSGARLGLQASGGGSNTGDAYMFFQTSTGFAALGLDMSDSSKFKIAMGDTGLGLVDTLTITQTGIITIANQLRASSGTVSVPAYSFSDDVDTGFYRIGADNIGVVIGGAKMADFGGGSIAIGPNATMGFDTLEVSKGDNTEGNVLVISNTVPGGFGPGIRFRSRRSDGGQAMLVSAQIYSRGINLWNTDGNTSSDLRFRTIIANTLTDVAYFSGLNGSLLVIDGSATNPGLSFMNDTDTGIYRGGTNQINIVANGLVCLSVNSNQQTLHHTGSASVPSIGFSNDLDTGFYNSAANEISVALEGVQKYLLGTSGILPAVDNSVKLGASGSRYSEVWAANGTIQTSHSTTKQNIVDVDPLMIPVPRGVEYDRDGRRYLGYLNDMIPDTGRPVDENGAVCAKDNYEQAVIGVLCAHVRKLESELADLKANAKFK